MLRWNERRVENHIYSLKKIQDCGVDVKEAKHKKLFMLESGQSFEGYFVNTLGRHLHYP